MSHFSNGFRILLGNNLKHLGSETGFDEAQVNAQSLHKLAKILEEAMIETFGGPPVVNLLSDRQFYFLPKIPDTFQNIDEARDDLCMLKRWIVQSMGQDLKTCVNHDRLVLRLLKWCAVYGNSFTEKDLSDGKKTLILYLYRELIYLYLLCPFTNGTTETDPAHIPLLFSCLSNNLSASQRRDAVNEAFAKILARAQSLRHPNRPFSIQGTPALALESGLIPTTHNNSSALRSTKVRHQVMSLLSDSRMGILQDNLGSYMVSERVAALEEAAMVHAGVVPKNDASKSVQLLVWLDERVLSRTVYEKVTDCEGFRWRTDWIKF
ncbi:MAG: hypothetical protein Q9227_006059 [Pyrenula ochraceoflavens]